MYITRMVIGNPPEQLAEFSETPAKPFPPFTEPVEFKFDEQVNLFAGPNATGKSNVLANLFDLLSHPIQEFHVACSWGMLEFSEPDWDALREWRIAGFALAPPSPNASPLIAIPAMRAGYVSDQPRRAIIKQDAAGFVAGSIVQPIYGENVQCLVDEFRSEIEVLYADQRSFLHDQYFEDDPELQGGYDWDEFHSGGNEYIAAAEMLRHALNISYACTREICREIIAGEVPHDATIVQESITDAGLPTVSANLEMGTRIKTGDPAQNYADASPLPIAQLSAGTQGTLWWIRLLALCLLQAFDYRSNWEKQPAILLIDEIENHLHPTWQRRVIPALLKHFPGLQIFATTHSPFVIAGLKAGQVHLLNRDANGVVTASSNTEDIIGWTADEILRVFMEVDDPTDDATAAAARELRQLRDAGPHPDEREEEQRQARMRELQQQVDRNLLAGGPRAAEDERFAENLAGILERYRQSRDLNQENG